MVWSSLNASMMPCHGTLHHTLKGCTHYLTTPIPGPSPTAPPLQTYIHVAPEDGEVPTGGGVVHIGMHGDTSQHGRCGLADVGFKRQNEVS